MQIAALSVDEPQHSRGLIKRLGLNFALGSDPEQTVVKSFGVQNPDTQELALHAVYIVSSEGEVFYRKVARRRPGAEELLDAIDAFRGVYPVTESRQPRPPRSVAWPENNFQTLLALTAADSPPAPLDRSALDEVLRLLRAGKTDDSIIRFKALAGTGGSEAQLRQAAAWLTRVRFIANHPDALEAGTQLAQRLRRVRELETRLAATKDADQRDEILQTLGKARGGLSLARAKVANSQDRWNLQYAQGMLRSYSEVGRVMAVTD